MKNTPLLFRGYHYNMQTYWKNYQDDGFTQLSLDLSSKCNYACDWCFNKDFRNKDDTGILNLDEKISLLKQSVKLGAKTLVIPGTGEPTLDPDLWTLVNASHNLGLITVVYSNLSGLNKEKIEYLFSKDVSIGIKMDSLKKDFFNKRYHARKSDFNKFQENLTLINQTYYGSNEALVYRTIANMVLTHENKEELYSISKYCKNNNLPLFIRPVKPVTWAEKNIKEWKKIGNPSGKLMPDKELFKLAKQHDSLFSPSNTLENHCALYSFGLTVKNNGDVQICPDHHDSRKEFSNIRNKSLKEIIKELNLKRTIKPGYCIMLPTINH